MVGVSGGDGFEAQQLGPLTGLEHRDDTMIEDQRGEADEDLTEEAGKFADDGDA
jgi:hypothetical protein